MTAQQDATDWNADMDAWGLDTWQRVHHLRRLHWHHRRVMEYHQAKADRLDRIQLVLGVLLVISVLVSFAIEQLA